METAASPSYTDDDLRTLPPYRYKPLREGEIRVLYVKPSGRLEDPIECVLRHGLPKGINDCPEVTGHDGKPLAEAPPPFPPGTTLDDAVVGVRYGALSYAWGPTYPDGSHFTHNIICDGQELKITASLFVFLRRMRCLILPHWPYPPPLQPLNYFGADTPIIYPVWIDQICINQHDVQEQGEQVQMMPTIYRTAITGFVWLGDMSIADEESLREAMRRRTFGLDFDESHKRELSRLAERSWFKRRW